MEYHSDKPVLGFRRFKIMPPYFQNVEHALFGAWSLKPWPHDKPMVAECLNTRYPSCQGGPLRQEQMCRCGLHLYYSFSDAQERTDTEGPGGHVVALCAAGGRILFDEIHCRCSIMQVVALIDPLEYGPHTYKVGIGNNRVVKDRTEDVVTWARKTAHRYSVPVLGLVDATEFGLELGGTFVYGVRDTIDGQEIVEGIDDRGRPQEAPPTGEARPPPPCSEEDGA